MVIFYFFRGDRLNHEWTLIGRENHGLHGFAQIMFVVELTETVFHFHLRKLRDEVPKNVQSLFNHTCEAVCSRHGCRYSSQLSTIDDQLFPPISYTPALTDNPVVARVSRAKDFAADTAATTALTSQPSTINCLCGHVTYASCPPQDGFAVVNLFRRAGILPGHKRAGWEARTTCQAGSLSYFL